MCEVRNFSPLANGIYFIATSKKTHYLMEIAKLRTTLPNLGVAHAFKHSIVSWVTTRLICNSLAAAAVVTRIQFPVLNSDEVIACQIMDLHRLGHQG